jgi:hypothetical protein
MSQGPTVPEVVYCSLSSQASRRFNQKGLRQGIDLHYLGPRTGNTQQRCGMVSFDTRSTATHRPGVTVNRPILGSDQLRPDWTQILNTECKENLDL